MKCKISLYGESNTIVVEPEFKGLYLVKNNVLSLVNNTYLISLIVSIKLRFQTTIDIEELSIEAIKKQLPELFL
jgi:hypothetical protein